MVDMFCSTIDNYIVRIDNYSHNYNLYSNYSYNFYSNRNYIRSRSNRNHNCHLCIAFASFQRPMFAFL
ncbi:hypothetical protein HUG17_2189 [Dermatophagoides farinae]|uniref:Uncharacterized protein n=1 Tax=Dermatophagoides farinae TaxID=6954 RepID=A0A9D4PA69_DERFA|nr:hypothetical protein HUG17_2189 [Dermatophagoides farinae]